MPSDHRGPLRSVRDQLNVGIFGQHTAVVDFCEENYQVTPYIAEFWNTLSNGAYIALGAFALHHARQQNLPKRAMACQVALIVLGIGSALFHATLMKTAMMLDDLPMIWLVSVLLYNVVQIDPTYTNKSLIALLIALNVIVVACDLSEANQVYHYAIFAFLASSAAGRFLYLIYSHPDALKPDVKRKALQYFFLGAAAILGGFAIWNVDNIYCDDIQPYKERFGQPLALLLEGHVWWHLLTAIGEYLAVTAGTCLVLAIQEKHPHFGFAGGPFGIPYLVRTDRSNGKKSS